MSNRSNCGLAVIACLLTGPQLAHGAGGPDVIVGELPSVRYWGNTGTMHAYSVATTSCNIGNQNLKWYESTTEHPVIAQNMYRLADGRLQQIGLSWLKHGFCALQLTACGSCQAAGPGCEQELGPGCSDPYDSFLNGQQSGLGPRFEVNPFTGSFSYPWSNPGGLTGNTIFKRIQVEQSELETPGALYFVEGHYVTADDAAAQNNFNNASYRRVRINSGFSVSVLDSTQRERPAIFAWKDHGLGANQSDPDVQVNPMQVSGEGRFYVGSKATDLGNGTTRFDYAVFNLNSDRSGGRFRVNLPAGANVSDVGFHDVDYHSGEPYDSTDWSATVTGSFIEWNSPNDFATDPNSNALRWGTMYNFWFTVDAPPTTGEVELGLFKPGTPSSTTGVAVVPDEDPPAVEITLINPPVIAPPGQSINIDAQIVAQSENVASASVFYQVGPSTTTGTFQQATLTPLGNDFYRATLSGADCGEAIQYYVSVTGDQGSQETVPDDAPAATLGIGIGTITIAFDDDVESDMGWTLGAPGDTATTGLWERVDPTGTTAQPEDDHTDAPGTICFVTGQQPVGGTVGSNDVDGGRTTLVSPIIDMTGAQAANVSYWRWFSNNQGGNPGEDVFEVEISNDGGNSWVDVEIVGPADSESSGGWFQHEFDAASLISLTSTMQLRFIADDAGVGGSIIEAAVDDVLVELFACETVPVECPGDANEDGFVNIKDINIVLGNFGAPGPNGDINNSGLVDIGDLNLVLGNFGNMCEIN